MATFMHSNMYKYMATFINPWQPYKVNGDIKYIVLPIDSYDSVISGICTLRSINTPKI